jgi:TnpA family transposase
LARAAQPNLISISPIESEAVYVLDGLFDHDTILEIDEHFTDTDGANDHVFALFALATPAAQYQGSEVPHLRAG